MILPANKHCDTASKDIEPGPMLLRQPGASSSEGFEGSTNLLVVAEAIVVVFLLHITPASMLLVIDFSCC